MMGDVRDLLAEARALTELWSPRIVGRVNDAYVKVARVRGDFPRHTHAAEDELFWVLDGRLELHFDDGRCVTLEAGQVFIVPRGTPHRPHAPVETCIALLEPVTTAHTGEVDSPLTKSVEEQLG